jgi:hypothetical protein
VDVEITDRADACSVGGGDWHNVLFCGDFARKLLGDFKSTVLQFCKLADLTPVDIAGEPIWMWLTCSLQEGTMSL